MAKKAEELDCWQLADKLRAEVIAICAQPHVERHFKFCDGFMDAAGSVCRNIQEGFKRNKPAQIVQFFDYALGSLEEVLDYLHESTQRKFIDKDRHATLSDMAEHTKAMALNFKHYHEAKLPPKPPRPRPAICSSGDSFGRVRPGRNPR